MAEPLVVRNHSLGVEEAKSRMDRYIVMLVLTAPNLQDCKWNWSQPYPGAFDATVQATAFGYSAGGVLHITETTVEAYGDIPWYAILYKARILQTISDGIDKGLGFSFNYIGEPKMSKKAKSGDEGCADRIKQIGAAAEVIWFLVASVGMHIKGDECDFECCREGAAKAREQVEKYASQCDFNLF